LDARVRIGLYVSTAGGPSLETLCARFCGAERAGFATAWTGQIFGYDALVLLAVAARATRRIELGSWVTPAPRQHPAALAQQALTVQAASRGRFVLGVGASHAAVVEKRLGLAYDRPLRDLREYLALLRPLLAGEAVARSGRTWSAALSLRVPGTSRPPPLLVAALGPRMLALAGATADGAAIWLGGPRYLETFAIPRLRDAADAAGRPPPRIVCALPIALSRDAARARRSAEAFLATSARLPAYRRVLARGEAASPADVAIVGDAAALAEQLDALAALGVSDFHAVPFPVEGEPGARADTLRFLAERARGAATA
jgi:F420-dependent oxidoreductase-like protein